MPASAILPRTLERRMPMPFTDRRQLRTHGLLAAAACILGLSLVILLLWVLFSGLASLMFERHQRGMAAPVLVVALWMLRRQPLRGLHILADLRGGEAQMHFVRSSLVPRQGIGVFLPTRWDLQVEDRRLDASNWGPASLHVGRPVAVRSAPRSGILLGIETIEPAAPGPAEYPMIADSDFSPQDREILRLLAEGLSDLQITRKLDLAPRHLQWRIEALMRRLGVEHRHDAIRQAREYDLLFPDSQGR